MQSLYYIHDPMCSWCWGFAPVLEQLMAELPETVEPRRLLGGLAPDSDIPMPADLRVRLQQTWRRIESHIPGTRFNFDFWTRCTPRRSTYPACRAVIAARRQGPQYDQLMTRAIQQAYYLQARNPSDEGTLVELAGELRLDTEAFSEALRSESIYTEFARERAHAQALGVDSFPSLVLADGKSHCRIPINYHDSRSMLARLTRR